MLLAYVGMVWEAEEDRETYGAFAGAFFGFVVGHGCGGEMDLAV